MEGAEINRVDGKVCGEVEAFAKGKGVASVGSFLEAESLCKIRISSHANKETWMNVEGY
jgi:hypothetical protein